MADADLFVGDCSVGGGEVDNFRIAGVLVCHCCWFGCGNKVWRLLRVGVETGEGEGERNKSALLVIEWLYLGTVGGCSGCRASLINRGVATSVEGASPGFGRACPTMEASCLLW